MKAKDMKPDGRCMTCIEHYEDCEHRLEQMERERRRSENVSRLLAAHRQHDIARVCLDRELESDELSTRWHKAETILA